MHSRKSLLFDNGNIQIKKNRDTDFEVTIKSFNGAELCKLLGLHFLHLLGEKYGKHRIGLYCHGGLACFEYISGPQTNSIRKDFIKVNQAGFYLRIACEINLKAVKFSDVNVTTGKY